MDPSVWLKLSTVEQLANVGAEVGRAITWRVNPAYGDPKLSFYRALEYLGLTINDPKLTAFRRRELCRVREVLIDWYYSLGTYRTTDDDWVRYFNQFGIAANLAKHHIQGK